ncbi:MAG: hypothetical protein ACK4JY_07730 [Brevundimonas sp.]|uniref:hypothetical protein n=1 Tax=Brevundimonas sp. TaxID=1871086 RepID=UPI00391AC7DD
MIALAGVCAIVAVFQIAGGLGFRWDPLNLAEKRADSAVAAAGRAKVDASARRIETAGAQETTRIVEQAAGDRAAATEIVHRYALQLEAPDHDPQVSPPAAADDGSDLRVVFGQLCDLRPAVCSDPGHAAATRDAGDGPPGLPNPGAAG